MKKRFTLKRILILLLIATAVIFGVQTIGRKILLPFPAKTRLVRTQFNYVKEGEPSCYTDNGNGMRLIFTDADGKVTNIVFSDKSSPLDIPMYMDSDGEFFYISGMKSAAEDTSSISERIVRYDTDGRNPVVIFEKPFRTGTKRNTILDLNVWNGKAFITETYTEENEKFTGQGVRVLSIDLLHPENAPEHVTWNEDRSMVYDAAYDPETRRLAIVDYLGDLYLQDDASLVRAACSDSEVVIAVDFLPGGRLCRLDAAGNALIVDNEVAAVEVYASYLSAMNHLVTMDDPDSGGFKIWDTGTKEMEVVTELPYSISFTLLLSVRLISVLFLFCVVATFLARVIRENRNIGKEEAFRRRMLVVAGVAVSVFISVFYTRQLSELDVKKVKDDLSSSAQFLSETFPMTEHPLFKEDNTFSFKTGGMENFLKVQQELDAYYGVYANHLKENGKDLNIILWKRSGENYVLVYDNYYVNIPGQSITDEIVRSADTPGEEVWIYDLIGQESYYIQKNLKDTEGNVVGIIDLSMDCWTVNDQVKSRGLGVALTLLTIFVVVYVLLSECVNLYRILSKQKKKESGEGYPEVTLIRTYRFFSAMVTGLESFVLVLVTKELLSSGGYDEVTALSLLALPATLKALGATLGTASVNVLFPYISGRKLSVFSCLALMLEFFGIILSINQVNFPFFAGLHFATGLTGSILDGTILSMIFCPTEESGRFRASNDSSMGYNSGMILGTLLAGFVTTSFGNAALYAVNLALVIPAAALMFFTIPKTSYYAKKSAGGERGQSVRETVQFLVSVPMLTFLLVLTLGCGCSFAFGTFTFPLLAGEMNLPALYSTDIYVFAMVLVLIAMPMMNKITKKMGHWKRSVLVLSAMGAFYLGYLLNSSILWVIILVVVCMTGGNMMNMSCDVLWPREAAKRGLDVSQISGIVSIIAGLLGALVQPILTTFMRSGTGNSVVILGIFAVICAVLFALLTRHSAMAKEQ